MRAPYRCIVIDPPWNESGGGKIKRGADRYYPLLKTPEIIRVIVDAPVWKPADDCHLWLWVTNSFLADGMLAMKELGFRYVTNRAWVKDRIGLGQYLRGQHELCLFGVKGKSMVPAPHSIASVLFAAKGEHSEKPNKAFQDIEKISPGPYLEMFARRERYGWDIWGNEYKTRNNLAFSF